MYPMIVNSRHSQNSTCKIHVEFSNACFSPDFPQLLAKDWKTEDEEIRQ
jgi:hypothetical protein